MSPKSRLKSDAKGSLLVIGLDIAALATSAHNAGYCVHVVDFYGDLDVRAVADRHLSLVEQVPGQSCGRVEEASGDALVGLARRLARDCSYDGILLSSGLEDSPDDLEALEDIAPILGNTPTVMSHVRDRRRFFESLERQGIPHPRTYFVSNSTEAIWAAEELGYPVVVKPNAGFGGANIRFARNEDELVSVIHEDDFLIQEYVEGVAASTSIMAARGRSVTLTVNWQLLGLSSLGSPGAFSYCGNVVPLDASDAAFSKCRDVSAKVAEGFGLVGSNGVDLVIDELGRPWVIEVNPRFQGTLECVERVLGFNLVEAHINACREGHLPTTGRREGYCVRLVLYDRGRSVVPDLRLFPEVRDVPVPGVIVERGEPLCSVLVEGESSGDVLLRSFEVAEAVYSSLRGCEDDG